MNVIEAIEAGRARDNQDLGPKKRVHEDVDLFDRAALNWLNVDPDTWILNAGEGGMVVLEAEGDGTWTVAHYTEGAGRRMDRVVEADGLDLGYAQGRAEELVRSIGGGALVDKKRKWRKQPPSVKQLDWLTKVGIRYETEVKVDEYGDEIVVPLISKGEASDLLSVHFAKRDIARLRRTKTKPPERKPEPTGPRNIRNIGTYDSDIDW
jgi:hypothetical protein